MSLASFSKEELKAVREDKNSEKSERLLFTPGERQQFTVTGPIRDMSDQYNVIFVPVLVNGGEHDDKKTDIAINVFYKHPSKFTPEELAEGKEAKPSISFSQFMEMLDDDVSRLGSLEGNNISCVPSAIKKEKYQNYFRWQLEAEIPF